MPALRLTAYRVICDLLKEYGLYDKVSHNKTANTIEYGTNLMVFLSVDNSEKLKSTEWNYIWMEETNEFTWEDFLILKERLSAKTKKDQPNQLFVSFNPSNEYCFINQKIIMNSAFSGLCQTIHSTYKDNPFLDKEYVNDLENLKEIDPDHWRIYGLGKWGVIRNVIYQPFLMDGWRDNFHDTYYGLDFGYNNPSALIEINEYDNEPWIKEKLYQRYLTNSDLIERLKQLIPEDRRYFPIYADSAEPARIEEIRAAGFNIKPAEKSVKDGIDYVRRLKIHSCPENVNLHKERASYKYREDKNGHTLDEPVKFNDHLMDAMRYAIYTHNIKQAHQFNTYGQIAKDNEDMPDRVTSEQDW